MSLDNWVSLGSATISFTGLVLVVLQLRINAKQREIQSLVEIYDINRQLLSLGFVHPKLFAILQDAKNTDPLWEKHYLQLWLNQLSLTHSYMYESVFKRELKDSLTRDLSDFLIMDNMRRHWRKYKSAYPVSFQTFVDDIIENTESSADSQLSSGI